VHAVVTANGTCASPFGTVVVSVSNGGVGPFVFSLWNGTRFSGDAVQLPVGFVQIYVTDATNATVYSFPTMIHQSDPIPSIQLLNIQNTTCFGDTTGSISVAGTGGTPPYSFHWNAGGFLLC
jgi:hypothetical protein